MGTQATHFFLVFICIEVDIHFPTGQGQRFADTEYPWVVVLRDDQGRDCCFIDIDECRHPGTCPDGRCVNSPGSYTCLPCEEGYIGQSGSCVGKG